MIVTANFIDVNKFRIMFKCSCGYFHVSKLLAESTFYLARVVRRICPVNHHMIDIRIKNDAGNIIAPLGSIDYEPNYYCKKCLGTGRFTYCFKTFTCECVSFDQKHNKIISK